MAFANLLDPNTFSRRDPRTLASLLDDRLRQEMEVARSNAATRASDLSSDYAERTMDDRAGMARDQAEAAALGLQGRKDFLNMISGLSAPGVDESQPAPEFGPQPEAPVTGVPPYLAAQPPKKTMSPMEMLWAATQTEQVDPYQYFQASQGGAGGDPTAFERDWGLFNAQSPEDQARMLEFKRANKVLDVGDAHVGLGPGGREAFRYGKTLKPGEQPWVKGAQAKAEAEAKEGVTGAAKIAAEKAEREKAEFEKKEAKDALSIESNVQALDAFLDVANLLGGLDESKLGKVFGYVSGQIRGAVPGETQTLINELNKLDAKTAIAQLQTLKSQSATGASGFGALSERELDVIINSLIALNPKMDPRDAKRELEYIAENMNKTKLRLKYGMKIPLDVINEVLDVPRPAHIPVGKWNRYQLLKMKEASLNLNEPKEAGQ